jgi:hypothetical protein
LRFAIKTVIHYDRDFLEVVLLYIGKGKGKPIPLQALTGPEGSRRLRLLDVKTIGT